MDYENNAIWDFEKRCWDKDLKKKKLVAPWQMLAIVLSAWNMWNGKRNTSCPSLSRWKICFSRPSLVLLHTRSNFQKIIAHQAKNNRHKRKQSIEECVFFFSIYSVHSEELDHWLSGFSYSNPFNWKKQEYLLQDTP